MALLIGLAVTVWAFVYLRRATRLPQANDPDSRLATLQQENENLRARQEELVQLLTEWLGRSR